MKRFFRALQGLLVLPVVAAGFAMYSCVKVDNTFGLDYVPEHEKMILRIDTLTDIGTYVVFSDSLSANYRSRILIGNMTDPVFGKTACGTVVQYYPSSNEFNDKKLFGFNPVADSVKFTFYVSNTYGKGDVEQTFYVYTLTDSLARDSVYYPDIPVENVVNFSKPVFSFTMKDEPFEAVKLVDITADGRDFLNKLVTADSAMYAEPYRKFRKQFYGLYIAPAPGSLEDAAVYNITMYESTYYVYSAMTVYGHNYDRQNPTEVQDTLTVRYIFSESTLVDKELPVNMSVNKITHTYPNEILNVLNDTVNSQPVTYVQGLSGVATMFDLGDKLLEQINKLKTYKDKEGNVTEYSSIVVNQARLVVPIGERTADIMDAAPSRLGMYTNYKGSNPSPIVDYQYYSEAYYGYTIPYNGYLNRSRGFYDINISAYIAYLINDREKLEDRTKIWVGPAAYTIGENYSQIVLNGSGPLCDDPVKLVLTYTLVK